MWPTTSFGKISEAVETLRAELAKARGRRDEPIGLPNPSPRWDLN